MVSINVKLKKSRNPALNPFIYFDCRCKRNSNRNKSKYNINIDRCFNLRLKRLRKNKKLTDLAILLLKGLKKGRAQCAYLGSLNAQRTIIIIRVLRKLKKKT